MQSVIKSNSAAIRAAILEQGISIGEASKACCVGKDLLGRLTRQDRPISFKTAGKLRRHFGEQTVIFLPTAQD